MCIVFTEIEEKQIDTKLRKLEEQYNVNIDANGYPTIFKISDGKVTYYSGNRTSDAMSNWAMNGGEPHLERVDEMPRLLADIQGGRRWHSSRRLGRRHKFNNRYNRSRRYKENYNYEKQQRHTKSKRTGLFDFLFGK